MNKLFVFAIPISLILGACEEQWVPALEDCEVVAIPSKCNPNPPAVTLNLMTHNAAPPNFCVKHGEAAVFRVVPPKGDTDTVRIIPKDETDVWPNGRNDPDANGFALTAPDKTGEYEYYVAFKDGHCIDPMIKVRDESL